MADNSAYQQYLDQLVEHRLLVPSGLPGLYGRSAAFEDVVDRFEAYVTRIGAGEPSERYRFPPVISRKNFETSEYLKSFPDMAGIVHSFAGNDRDHLALLSKLERGEEWSAGFPSADVVLTPAACYPVYPMMTGTLPEGGRHFDVLSYCFRHEPSIDPARMQTFRQREYVRAGRPDDCVAFRELWKERGTRMLRSVGLDANVDLANDPFFGRAGKMLVNNQREQALKFELLVAICSAEKPTACVSFNYHQDHFGSLFQIKLADGSWAHTACVGFGLERITLALFKTHGFDSARWPKEVREVLWP